MDIRLKEVPFRFGERDFLLRCNMAVLADVQEANGGDLLGVINGSTLKSTLIFAAAMMNDFADEQGWPERYTAAQLGRQLKYNQKFVEDIMSLVMGAVVVTDDSKDQ